MALGGMGASKECLEGIVDSSLQAKVEQLKILFSHQSTSEIRYVLEAFNGNFYDALDVLSGSPGPSSSQSAGSTSSSSRTVSQHEIVKVKEEHEDYETLEDIPNHKTREKVANLLALGISYPIAIILDVLGNCNWNANEAAIILLNGLTPIDTEAIHSPVVKGTSQEDGASTTSTSFDPTPPPTPPCPKVQVRYPGGVIPSMVLHLRDDDAIPLSHNKVQVLQRPVLEEGEEKNDHDSKIMPSSKSCNALGDDSEMVLGESNEQLVTSSIYGFDNNAGTEQENIDVKVDELHEMLPKASRRRCKIILQLFPDIEEAFDNLFEEIAEHGSDESGSETEDDDDDDDSGEEDRSKRIVRGRENLAMGSRGEGKRRAGTPEEEPPMKKSRLVVDEELDGEAEAARLEPAGDWVLNTFGENGGISVTLAGGDHPCKFSKGLLCRHFTTIREQFSDETTTIDLPDVSRGLFDLVIQLAITKSVRLHESQYKTRSTEITALIELVILATRLELPGAGYIIAARLKEILINKRDALQGSHIEMAYTLKKGHPIRKVIVQSLGRAHFTLQQGPPSKKAQVYRRGEGDNARRSAFGGDRFLFQDQIDSIDDFNLELSRQAVDILHDRNVNMSRSGKTRTITYTDPLSEEDFSL
ncbi:hypothetical protein N431DRAFT_505950 [Stipitochalara longipes BDJ]|nr:hypothetical protein N431DRAFT_505950 [Stipitochalara longipes BDJ]